MTSVAPTTVPGETPILDREAPLPPRAAPGSGLAVVLAIWLVVAALVTAGLVGDWPPVLRQWIFTELRPWVPDQLARTGVVGIGLSVVAAFYLMVAVHEFGHVLAGWCVGFCCRSYRVGPVVIRRRFRVSVYRGPGALTNGVAEMVPVAPDHLAGRGVVMVLGGPLINLLSALVVLLLPIPVTMFSACFIAFSVVNGVNDLVPFESRLGLSDGRRIGMLWRRRAHGERWLALLRLGGELDDGVLPEALSADFLARAVAVRDDSADTVTAHAIAYAAAFHLRQDVEAGRMLETALAHAGRAMAVTREALMSDAAVFQARRRKRPDLAEQWLADIPAATPNGWFRTRAAAAILEAKGDVDGAADKLAEVEAAIRTFPETARRAALLQLLQRWRADLGRS